MDCCRPCETVLRLTRRLRLAFPRWIVLSLVAGIGTAASLPAAPPEGPPQPEDVWPADSDDRWISLEPLTAPRSGLQPLQTPPNPANPVVSEQPVPVTPSSGTRLNRLRPVQDRQVVPAQNLFIGPGKNAESLFPMPPAQPRTPVTAQPAPVQPLAGSSPPQTPQTVQSPALLEINPAEDPAEPTVPGTGEELKTAKAEPLPQERLSLESIAAQRARVEAADLPGDVKATAISHYNKALEDRKRADAAAERIAKWRSQIDQAAALIEAKRQELVAPLPEMQQANDPADVTALEQLKLTEQEELQKATRELEEWEAATKQRGERQPQMPVILGKHEQTLAEARAAMQSPPASGENPEITDARRIEQAAAVAAVEKQLESARVEQLYYEALKDFFPLQRDVIARRKKHFTKLVEQRQTLIAEARRQESERQAAAARQALQDAHPDLRDLATRNAELTKQRTELQDQIARIHKEVDEIGHQLKSIEADYENAREKVERVEGRLTTAVGMFLNNQRDHLPNVSRFQQTSRDAAEQMSEMQSALMPLEDEQKALGDPAALAIEITQGIEAGSNTATVEQMALTLIQDKKRYLDDLIHDYQTALQDLAELDVRSQRMTAVVTEFRQYIDERVLWIKSAPVMDLTTVKQSWAQLVELLGPVHWGEAIVTATTATKRHLSLSLAILLGGIGLVWLRVWFSRYLPKLAALARAQKVSPLLAMPVALLLTFLTASGVPALVALAGWKFRLAGEGLEFSEALGRSIMGLAIFIAAIELFRHMCRRGGIGEVFLGWPEKLTRRFNAALGRFLFLGSFPAFLVGLARHAGEGQAHASLGRIAFLCMMGLLLHLFHQLGKTVLSLFEGQPRRWNWFLLKGLYAALLVCPIAFAGLSIAGYQYTASKLLVRLDLTLILAATLATAVSFARHWMDAARGKLLLRKRLQMLHRLGQKPAGGDAQHTDQREDRFHLADQLMKLPAGLAAVLFLCGTWMIWVEVLPALQVVRNHELYRTTVLVEDVIETADGGTRTELMSRPMPVTLGHLFLVSIIAALTFFAMRHLRAVLEFTLFRNITVDAGVKHAIATMGGYAIALGGIVYSCKTLGIGWPSVQWLVAALTVGLGFGLQEIFANFVSGLILLLERPVRVGDVVTIDQVTGTVSRIHIRATTILDWDRKEYIVPNKEFVTGRLLNWTLSNQVNRLLLPVGVAYGTDTDLARQLMVEAAANHPNVLKDPAPVASFDEFGGSSLNLTLRCFLPDLTNRISTITELNRAIDLAFREHNIEIPFPQMDLHVRDVVGTTVPMQHPLAPQQPRAEQKAA